MERYTGKYHYMSAWGYVGLDILYSIPIVGFVFLLVHSFSSSNENRQHYARSYFARLLLVLIVLSVIVLIAYLSADSGTLTQRLEQFWQQLTGAGRSYRPYGY